MTRVSLLGRLTAMIGVLLLMASATAALALPIEPGAVQTAAPAAPAVDVLSISAGEPVTVGTTVSRNVWNFVAGGTGPNSRQRPCGIQAAINIDGVSDAEGLGGFETRLSIPDGRGLFTDTNAAEGYVMLTNYLASTGRNTSGTYSGDPDVPLLAEIDNSSATTDSIKFADYSWDDAPAANGPVAAGTLATVTIVPSATCGAMRIELSESQLVDPSGNLFAEPTAVYTVNVRSRYDLNANNLIQSNDALLVVNRYNLPGSANCGALSRYDVNGNGLIQSNDALLIVNKYNQPITSVAACTGP